MLISILNRIIVLCQIMEKLCKNYLKVYIWYTKKMLAVKLAIAIKGPDHLFHSNLKCHFNQRNYEIRYVQ